MTPLKNQRKEKFCLELFGGMSQKDAAIAAGYKPSRARQTASRLVTNGDIIERLKELNEAASSDKVMTALERKEKLSVIARADLTEFIDEDGSITLEGESTAALQAVSIEDWKGGKDGRAQSQNKKVKLISAIQAIQELNKMDGDYAPDKHLIEGDIPVSIVYKKKEE